LYSIPCDKYYLLTEEQTELKGDLKG
jgi:hypothetical protein